MRISTKGCYGLRAMVELGLRFGGGPVLMRSIADRQGLSRKYLHSLLSSLRSAGLVRSIRGSSGGYMLSRPPMAIKVREVLESLEGSLACSTCADDKSTCSRSKSCVGREMWREVSREVERMLGNITLEDLLVRQRNVDHRAVMYHI